MFRKGAIYIRNNKPASGYLVQRELCQTSGFIPHEQAHIATIFEPNYTLLIPRWGGIREELGQPVSLTAQYEKQNGLKRLLGG